MAAMLGPIIGTVLGLLDGLGTRTVDYPNGQWDYFEGYIYYCSAISFCVAAALVVAIDLPEWVRKIRPNVEQPSDE